MRPKTTKNGSASVTGDGEVRPQKPMSWMNVWSRLVVDFAKASETFSVRICLGADDELRLPATKMKNSVVVFSGNHGSPECGTLI